MAALNKTDAAYEAAEAAYLSALRAEADRAVLAQHAASVARAAAEWNTVAYEALRASSVEQREDLDALTERTEVLSELWADIAAAYSA